MNRPKTIQYIHNYDQQLNAFYKRVEKIAISRINKDLILEFEKQCFIKEHIALPTRVKYLDVLSTIALKHCSKDFDKLERKDFEDIVLGIQEREDISISTKQKYTAILKKFGRWLVFKDKMFIPNGIKKYPETVEWINTHIKAKDKPRIKASEILTEEEIEKLINTAETPQHKAFISMLYELGARIGEIGMLNVGDVNRDEYSYIVDLSGKTGHRTPRIILSDPYLTTWLNQHPFRENKEAPLWIAKDKKTKQFADTRLKYNPLVQIINRIVKKTNIKKNVYPHLFRHSRVTHLLKNKQINESQAKVYFGWTPSSKVLSEYSHLVSGDVNETLLEINGIKIRKESEIRLRSKQCYSCKNINSKEARFCQYCSKPLDFQAIEELEQIKSRISDLSLGFAQSGKPMEVYLKELIKKEIRRNIK